MAIWSSKYRVQLKARVRRDTDEPRRTYFESWAREEFPEIFKPKKKPAAKKVAKKKAPAKKTPAPQTAYQRLMGEDDF